MKHSGICKRNIYETDKLPDIKEKELFEEIFESERFLLERIISNGWNRIDDQWYDQKNDEWVLLMKGNATIEFENKPITELNEGDYLFIPAHCRHKVIHTSSKPPCIWLAIHFRDTKNL